MSESTPEKKTNKSNRRRATLAPPRNGDAAWLIGSIALHVLAAAVLWFTPVRDMLLAPKDPEEFEVTARAERIEEMVEYLRNREADEIIQYLEEMLDIEENVLEPWRSAPLRGRDRLGGQHRPGEQEDPVDP